MAEAILSLMMDHHSRLQPDLLIYLLAIDAWSHCETIHWTKKAHKRLIEMIDLLSKKGNPSYGGRCAVNTTLSIGPPRCFGTS